MFGLIGAAFGLGFIIGPLMLTQALAIVAHGVLRRIPPKEEAAPVA